MEGGKSKAASYYDMVIKMSDQLDRLEKGLRQMRRQLPDYPEEVSEVPLKRQRVYDIIEGIVSEKESNGEGLTGDFDRDMFHLAGCVSIDATILMKAVAEGGPDRDIVAREKVLGMLVPLIQLAEEYGLIDPE